MTQDFYVTLDANFASSFPGLEWSFSSKEGSSLSISPIEDNSNNLVKKMEPTECAKVEPPAPAAAASASVSLPSSQQSSVPAATDASAASTAQRNHPNASNGNSAFAVAAAAAASQASNAKPAVAAAAKENRPSASASAAVEHKIGGGGELDSEVKECKKTVGSEGASEAARSDSAGNNNFPKKASVEEEKNKAVEMGPMDPANKGKINAE